MRKFTVLLIAIFLVTATGVTGFAKGKAMPFGKGGKGAIINGIMGNGKGHGNNGSNGSMIQKGLDSIAPSTVNPADPQLLAQLDAIQKASTNYNTQSAQVMKKKMNAQLLINQIRQSRKQLTTDQYSTLTKLVATADAEAKKIVSIKELNVALKAAQKKDSSKLANLTAQDLATMLTTLNANTASLSIIDKTYDSIISMLTIVNTTTPASITLTTAPAISH